MFVTDDVSQLLMYALKVDLPINKADMSVTRLVYQCRIVPYGLPDAHAVHSPSVGASAKQISTKSRKLEFKKHLIHAHELTGPRFGSVHVYLP